MTYSENYVTSKVDDFRVYVFDAIKGVANKDDYSAMIELFINELENMPTFEELPTF